METLFITKQDCENFLKGKIKEKKVYAPIEENQNLFLNLIDENNVENIVYNKFRTVEPLKIFLLPIVEKIVNEIENFDEIILIGIASCDLKGLEILDNVFANGEYKDPNYKRRRENLLIISTDCYQPSDTCFCEIVGTNPYPEKNFDINFSMTTDGFIVEIATEKGNEFIGKDNRFFNATVQQIDNRNVLREKTVKRIKEINEVFNLNNFQEKIKGVYETEKWEKINDIKNCVSCGSCNFNCPSCVCFFLEDTSEKENFEKIKFWDSCLFPGYARMASGATPRPNLHSRYANRLLCKYDYMVSNFNILGCTGCGRCISGCIGKIDKRRVISELVKEVVK
ncbi:MAG TPA: 4Fe-4S dicluster domain-containing protein [Candidatus Ratteibacteria bacterium]|nr:4Fe-4S dicluster domain-containing protein [bacterium]HRR96725.1 4Fe-4S dicluster domain-containing protein [Candidatus Ratteibacteria bacterium]